MHKLILFFAVIIFCSTLQAGDVPIFRAGFFSPKSLLANYPLDTLDKQAAFNAHGPAHKTIKLPNGSEGWVYEVGEGYGLRTYTLEFSDSGVVINVLYNDKGPLNGINARDVQSEAKKETTPTTKSDGWE